MSTSDTETFDGTQESYWQRQSPVLPLETAAWGLILAGPLLLFPIVAFVFVVLPAEMLLMKVAVALASGSLTLIELYSYHDEISSRVRFLHVLRATLGVRSRYWPAWTLQEADLQDAAERRLDRLLRRHDESTQKVTYSLAENFQGTLHELVQTSQRLTGTSSAPRGRPVTLTP